MTKLEEKATEFAKTEFHRPYSDTPEEAIVIVDPDKYKGFIGGYKEALEDVRKELERRAVDDYSGGEDIDQDETAQGVCAGMIFFIDNLTK